ncbi:MAG: hypothetical protein PUE01_12170 [Clostridiaceae bacterium]|nr:hypothetical protein [Clostridiaceae bacterium]
MGRIKHIKNKFSKDLSAEFSIEDAKIISEKLGINFAKEQFDLQQFLFGINVELEHGKRNPKTNVTNDEPILTGKIALAHLMEFPDYYIRLKKLEEEAKAYWQGIKKAAYKLLFCVKIKMRLLKCSLIQ